MDSDENELLNELNNEEVIRQVPLIIYLIIMCVSGIVGNSLVCFTFAQKFMSSTYHIYVTVLSVVDLLTCLIALPLQLSLQFHQYNLKSVWQCKIALFLNTWTTITSGALLLFIAFDRYRKACALFSWKVTPKAAKNLCILSTAIGLASSWISPIIYGIQKRELSAYNITISRCGVTSDMKETLFPLINNIVFAILFLGALITISTFYCFIAVRVKRQIKWRQRVKCGTENCETEHETTPGSIDTIEQRTDEIGNDITVSNEQSEPVSNDKDMGKNQEKFELKKDMHHDKGKSFSPKLSLSRSSRTTLIMFVVSLVFVISYLPLISLLLIRSLNKKFVPSLNDIDRSVYNFFLRSYFLNCAINPIIYGLLDARFRKECKSRCSRVLVERLSKLSKH